jgi:hypothetical protein
VNRFLAYFLVVLMLLQSFGRELLVLDYELNKAQVTELYCVNKARPQLHCNGKCHLARQLRKTEGSDQKAPAGLAKVKYEVLPTSPLVLAAPRHWRPAAPRFAPRPPACYAFAPLSGVFRPPLA